MAFDITSTYAGEASQEYLVRAILGANTLAGEYVTILTNLKNKRVLPTLDFSGNLIQADSCNPTPSGDILLNERTIETAAMMVYIKTCITDLESTWESQRMTAGAMNSDVPNTLKEHILSDLIARISSSIEQIIWTGSVVGGDEIDGFVTLLTADGGADVVGTTLSAANIIAEISKVYNAIPEKVLSKGGVKIFISPAAARFYKQALAAVSVEAHFVKNYELNYIDVPLVVINGMPTNTMVAARKETLFVGTDLRSDMNEVGIYNLSENSFSRDVEYGSRFRLGVQYSFRDEIALYA